MKETKQAGLIKGIINTPAVQAQSVSLPKQQLEHVPSPTHTLSGFENKKGTLCLDRIRLSVLAPCKSEEERKRKHPQNQ
jgi:hypothetical protein